MPPTRGALFSYRRTAWHEAAADIADPVRIELTSPVLETGTLPLSYGHIGDTRIFTVVHHHVPTSRREWESNPHALARRLFSKQLPPPIGWPLQVSQRIARSVCNDLRALPDILCNQSRLGA